VIRRIKGTLDVFGEQARLWRYIESTFIETVRSFNYREMRTPIIEPVELFVRSVGEETDIVRKEMYVFEDKGGRKVALRPEGTAGIVRAYIENGMNRFGAPQKFFYIGAMFRYEKPQAGRQRQFHQLGVEVFGSPSPLADVETIHLAMKFLKNLGLDDARLHVNSIGCPKCRPSYKDALKKYYSEYLQELCEDCKIRYDRNVLRLLDCKVDSSIAEKAPRIQEFLCDECREHFVKVCKALDALNLKYTVDPKLVRGLDYYTRTTYEIKVPYLGAQDTLIGGGRYDNLVRELGGPSTPAVGFAGGIERIALALEKKGIVVPRDILIYVATAGQDDTHVAAITVAETLRDRGFCVEIDLMERSLTPQMRYANRAKADYVVMVGEDELREGKFTLRDMKTGEQRKLTLHEMVEVLEKACKLLHGDS